MIGDGVRYLGNVCCFSVLSTFLFYWRCCIPGPSVNSSLCPPRLEILINTVVITSNLVSTETEFYNPNFILRHIVNWYEAKDGVHLTADVLSLCRLCADMVRLLLAVFCRHSRPDVGPTLPSYLIDRWQLRHTGLCLSSELVYLWSRSSWYWIDKHVVCWVLVSVNYLKIKECDTMAAAVFAFT